MWIKLLPVFAFFSKEHMLFIIFLGPGTMYFHAV